MSHRYGGLFVLALTVLMAACGGSRQVILVTGVEVYEYIWVETVEKLEGRASFDLECPPNQLEYTLLGKQGKYPNEVGVAGCGNRAVYLRPNIRTHTWVMNSTANSSQTGQ